MKSFANKLKSQFSQAVMVAAVLASASVSDAAALPIENENEMSAVAGRVISRKVDQRFGIMRLEDSIWCNTYDMDKDGKLDMTRVELSLRNTLHDGAGILNLTYMQNEFAVTDNAICEKIQKIIDSAHMMFGATYGGFDSTLTLHSDRLVEDLTVRLHSARSFNPGEQPLTLTMTAKIEKTLN